MKSLSSYHEIFEYKDLLFFLVKREIIVLYKQTVLGFLWAIIRPLITMVIFTFIFSGLAKIPSDGVPYQIFSFCALVPWYYFSSSLNKSTNSLLSASGMFTKVYFPRIIIPLVPIISGLVDFLISFLVLIIMMFYYDVSISITIIYLPFLVLIICLFSFGIGLWLSALALQYRDVKYAISYFSQILMYAAPVVWPMSVLSEKYGDSFTFWYGLYPMVGVIEGFRSILLTGGNIPWEQIFLGFTVAILLTITGTLFFLNKEETFADII